MALLIGLIPFGGIISSTPVSADSAASGNDAADSESTATTIPSENMWYYGGVEDGVDEFDYYTIDVGAGETMKIEVIGPDTSYLDFWYRLNGTNYIPQNGHNIDNGQVFTFFADNSNNGNELPLYLYFQSNHMPGWNFSYCFKVNHINNMTSAHNANPCAPVIAPTVSVYGNTEGTSILWDISFVNLTNDAEVTLNYSVTLDSAIQESNSISWTAQSDYGSESVETDFVTAGEWCLDATLWQHDQPQHVSDSFCINVEEVGNSMVNIDWIDTDASLGGGDAQFSVESSGNWTAYWGITNTNSAPSFPLWSYTNGWWDASASGGLGTTTGNGDSTWIFQNMESWGALAPPSCNILMIALFDGNPGSADGQSTPATGDPVSVDYQTFEYGDITAEDCDWDSSWTDESIDEQYLFVSTEQRHWDVVDDGVLIQFEAGGLDPSIEWVLEAQLFFLPGIIDPEPNYELEEVELMLTADSVNDPRYGISVDENGMSTFELDLWGLGDECYLLEYDLADKETLGTYMIGPFDHYFSVGTGDCGELIDNTVINDWCDQLEGFAGDVWDPLVTYSPGDVVEYPANSGQFYKAKSLTSGDIPSDNSDAWDGPCTCEDIWTGQVWSATGIFSQWEIVQDGGKLWISKLNSNSGHQPSTSPSWWRACSSECAVANGSVGWWYWQNNELYQMGDVVEYPANSGRFFVSTMDNNGAHPKDTSSAGVRGWIQCSCEEIWEAGSQPKWDANSHYDTFEVVEHNGEYYVRTFAYNLPFSTTPEPGVNPTWKVAWKKCDPESCSSTGPYSQIYANMGMYDKGVAVTASFASSKVWISTVEDNSASPPAYGVFASTWTACFEDPKPPIKPDLVAEDWVVTPGGTDDEDIRRYARMMKGSVITYTDDVTDKRESDSNPGERCLEIDMERVPGSDKDCEDIEVLVIGSDTSKYGCLDSWPPKDNERLPWNEGCEMDDDSGSIVFENKPPIVVSTCDIDALNNVGVYVESNDRSDVLGHLLIESTGMNPGEINCGAQVLFKVDFFSEYLADEGTGARTKYVCKDPSACFIDVNGDCWVKPSGGDWTIGKPDGRGNCDTGNNQPTPFPPWMLIQNVRIEGSDYVMISAPGHTCDTIDLSDLLLGSTCNDAVTEVGQPVNPSSTSTTTRAPGGTCTDTTHQLYETIIASSAVDTRWFGNGLMQPSNLVTPDPSWGTFTAWGDDAEWVGQPFSTTATNQPQGFFFTHEFTLPFHAYEFDFYWHGMASDQFGYQPSGKASHGVMIDGYLGANLEQVILSYSDAVPSSPHHDQEVQWTGGKTWNASNPNQKYILQTAISNDGSQSIQGLIYELKIEFCMDPQYEHHLPNLPPLGEPDIDPGLGDGTIADQVSDDSIPGFLATFSMMAMVVAAIAHGRRKDAKSNQESNLDNVDVNLE